MAVKLPVWGIDVGQCSLKAIKLQPDGDQVEMLAFEVIEHEQILSQAGTEAANLIRSSIQKFLEKHDLRNARVVVSVPGQQTLTRFTKMPPVEAKKIPDMVKYEAGQQIPFDMDEVVWDYQIFTEPDSPDIEVGIFAIRRELIRNHLAQFTELGIEPVIAQASPMASYNAVRYDRPAPGGEAMILLDMGALSTDLIVMEGNTIWSRPVPIGGNRFTEALVTAFKVSFRKAEDLKRNASSTKYARQIFQAMRPVFADLVSEVQRSIGFYTSTHREAHITKALGMGNAFKLPGLQKFLQQNLQIEFEKLGGFTKLVTGAAGQTPEFTDNIMTFSVAYGLALQGLGLAAVESSLLPPEIRKNILWKKKRVWFGAAAACVAGAAASIWLKNSIAVAQLNDGLGSMSTPTPVVAANVDDAQRTIESPPPIAAPVEYAAKLTGAVQKLKNEFSGLQDPTAAGMASLTAIAKLPGSNVLVPRIVDVVQRAVNESTAPEFRALHSVDEYLATVLDANQKPKVARKQREELWVENMTMAYNPQDADAVFGQEGVPAAGGKPGWGVRIIGVTTKAEPAKWLEEVLIRRLDELGKQPGRGLYFDRVALYKVGARPERSDARDDTFNIPTNPQGGAGTPAGRPGRFGPGARGEDRGPGTFMPPPTGPGMNPAGRGKTLTQEIEELKPKPGFDPLTGEETKTDWQFEIHLVAFVGDTPKEKIPAVYKPADTKPGEAGKTAEPPKKPAAPPPPPRRD